MVGYGKRILVVDGDADRRALLETRLEQLGYAAHMVCDGVSGLDEMRKRRFDAVITDGHMSGFIGHQFAGFIKNAWPETPLILLSGDPDDVSAGADDFETEGSIDRPYEPARLLNVLCTAIEPASREQATVPMEHMQR